MNRFHNILFVSCGIKAETEALQQAIQLAENNQANLELLIVGPQFPKAFEQYKKSYEAFLREHINKAIEAAQPAKKKITIKVDIEWGSSADTLIIQRVLRQSHDLVIKAVESNTPETGYKALDMSLLRKCPCTLFLQRPLKKNKVTRIAVAIDPEHESPSGEDLTQNLLKLAHTLAMHYKGELSIISCWDFVLENFLRNNAWLEMPTKELDNILSNEGNANYATLNKLIHNAGLKDKPTIYHLKGNPTELIPSIITEKKIDILVMGTVARTGISGFIIGNTAEDILQKLDCSLWALKPQGFISPVKAY